jgi:ATP-dependent HslUV protease ATP-binding subunit HslU
VSGAGFTPRELVQELDKFIVGQADAKRAVAVAVRNRWRRKQLSPELRDEVSPKNIIMIGPTGVGKTEIARRLAALVRSPFVKVEASKFTEVGYVGRDVESMVRDLVDAAVDMVRAEMRREVEAEAREVAEEQVVKLLLPDLPEGQASDDAEQQRRARSQEKFRGMLRDGKLNEREVEVSYQSRGGAPPMQLMGGMPGQAPGQGLDLGSLFKQLGGGKQVTRKVLVPEAVRLLTEQEADKRIDHEKAGAEAVERAQADGIVFLDEIDKIAVSENRAGGSAEVSRQGVQRDLLPIVEGSTVQTRHGLVRTDHILFIAAGAFHMAKPSDLIPELQGRFPIRVELSSLGKEDFQRILVEPEAALTKQYSALLGVEGVSLDWRDDGIERLAELAREVNATSQDIGARRLHTLVERLLEELLFEAADCRGVTLTVDRAYVEGRLGELVQDEDLSRYIL